MNRQNVTNFILFVLLAAGLAFGWWYTNKTFFPPKPEPERQATVREARMAVASGLAGSDLLAAKPPTPTPPKPEIPPAPVVATTEKAELLALGGPGFAKRVLLTTQGAAVQQVILQDFDESTREGKDSKEDGKSRPLHLIPGTPRFRDKNTIRQQWDFPAIQEGKIENPGVLDEPSYVLCHYPAVGDPQRLNEENGVKPDYYPSPLLGTRVWKTVEHKNENKEGSDAKAVFETELGAPYFIRIRKTYTLAPKDYHLGLKLEFAPLPGRVPGSAKLKYQIAGARGLPIEGEWFTSTYRNTFIGWSTPRGAAKRDIEDAAGIQHGHGGTDHRPTDGPFTYAGVGNQYFASVLAIDEDQKDEVRKNLWDSVRSTREHWSGYTKSAEPIDPFLGDEPDKAFLGDITVRTVSAALDPQDPAQPITHKLLIYNGPLKVRLLKQLKGDRAVRGELVERYLDKLTLKTLADYHSPNWFARQASGFYWTDLVILFTNVMHDVLGWLNSIVPVWGLDILLLTVMVRLLLMMPSRKQQMMMANMQAKMAAMKPELDKLAQKYKDDYQTHQREKTKLMLQHGFNPLSQMSGCFLMLLQMPIFLGLYFCLQESIFFRLESFLWIPNLAAPDMLIWWSEQIPLIANPNQLGGTFFLGPYFNVLPIAAVLLMFFQQKMSMPPPTDEQQAQQQKMMKFMMIFMGIFFYKMAAGLCLYFIASTTWAVMERKLLPKPTVSPPGTDSTSGSGVTQLNGTTQPAGPPGFLSRLKSRVEEMKRQADEQSGRQIRNEPRPDGESRRDGKKKRRK